MSDHPLASPPSESPVLQRFCTHFGVDAAEAQRSAGAPPTLDVLDAVVRHFSTIPYENLSKILKLDQCPVAAQARRSPDEVIEGHVTRGTGGTCFSLTATFLHIVRALGWRAEPILADRHYGSDTHCAMLLWIEDRPHLIDPGYLIVKPVSLEENTERRVTTSFNDILLVPEDNRNRLTLFTESNGSRTERLTFKLDPVDAGEFLRAWDASFGWDMMTYPVLTRAAAAGQLYLQNCRLQKRDRESLSRTELEAVELPVEIERLFGIDARWTASVLDILHARGEGAS